MPKETNAIPGDISSSAGEYTPATPPGEEFPRGPIVTVDVVLLTLKDEQLQVALCKRAEHPFQSAWSLPGGWVHPQEDEDALEAAVRILRDKAALQSPYLEQLGAFSGAHRDPRGWAISVAYYAVVPQDLLSAGLHPHIRWAPVDTLRSLPFDHLAMLHTAVQRVRSKTAYSSLPVYLLPKKFTLSRMQAIYEHLIGGALDKRTFRRWVESLDMVQAVPPDIADTGARHRPAQFFTLKPEFSGKLALTSKALDLR